MFSFLPRPQLGQLVAQIADWYFSRKAQFYLHECGQVTLGELWIKWSANGHGPIIIKDEQQQELPLADVPMPENIKNFKRIYIRFTK